MSSYFVRDRRYEPNSTIVSIERGVALRNDETFDRQIWRRRRMDRCGEPGPPLSWRRWDGGQGAGRRSDSYEGTRQVDFSLVTTSPSRMRRRPSSWGSQFVLFLNEHISSFVTRSSAAQATSCPLLVFIAKWITQNVAKIYSAMLVVQCIY